LIVCGWCQLAAQPKPDSKQPSAPDLSEYRTVANAITAKVVAGSGQTGQTGYLGLAVRPDGRGRLVVEEVQPGSPADKAGIKLGDTVLSVAEHSVRTPDELREWVQTHGPGVAIKIRLKREDKETEVSATLSAVSRPMVAREQPAFLGTSLVEPAQGTGGRVEQVVPGSAAANAGLKVGDLVVKINGEEFAQPSQLTEMLEKRKPGDVLTLLVQRDGKELELKATLTARRRERGDRGSLELWRKEQLRLGVICIEFPDTKHSAKIARKDWEEALFSRGSYTGKKNAQEQTVHGSLRDYIHEVSAGKLRLEGKVFDWVEVSKKRDDYQQGTGTSNKSVVLEEALGKVTARDGKEAFKDLDGFLFLYAGDRVRTNRGALYYPHAGIVPYQSKRWPYLLGPENGSLAIGNLVKELGEMLGLPDLAARPENVGSEGLGVWCCMSDPLPGSRPQHFSAWSKEKLGWIKPTVIDPTVKQKLILAPIEDSPSECFKVLVRPDGSEYFLLEDRKKKGFDSDLPGEGLLIWRVVNDRPILEESHGVEGPSGPRVNREAIPYPSSANQAFTPETVPSSRSPLGGGLPVRITAIRRLPDGRITFHIGYQYR
jgi:M6 family metalloprotease-like protein